MGGIARSGRIVVLAAAVLASVFGAGTAAAADAAGLWRGLAAGETVALMRHASAPGLGDPANFALDDCDTQRNLSAAGRAEARAIGARLRDHGIDHAVVRSSRWCRCLDTARLLDVGEVVPTPALDSFFEDREAGPGQTRTVRRLLADDASGRPRVLVTHQVNITALTDVFPASGEIVVVRPGPEGLAVVGRIAPP
ncbi:histidine phosphatase family protein [Salinisphaera orenii]